LQLLKCNVKEFAVPGFLYRKVVKTDFSWPWFAHKHIACQLLANCLRMAVLLRSALIPRGLDAPRGDADGRNPTLTRAYTSFSCCFLRSAGANYCCLSNSRLVPVRGGGAVQARSAVYTPEIAG
jgi:hypothetical protein